MGIYCKQKIFNPINPSEKDQENIQEYSDGHVWWNGMKINFAKN